jgi:hypothetical protein
MVANSLSLATFPDRLPITPAGYGHNADRFTGAGAIAGHAHALKPALIGRPIEGAASIAAFRALPYLFSLCECSRHGFSEPPIGPMWRKAQMRHCDSSE